MPTLEITTNEILQLVEQLNIEEKKKLFERIKSEIIPAKWDQLLARIDANMSVAPINDDEIEVEVESAREELAKNRC